MTPEQEARIDNLLTDREAFNAYVYTPWSEAIEELERRQQDPELTRKAHALIPNGVPAVLEGKKSMVLFRHLATPNYEVSRFLIGADALTDRVQPVILEYSRDKFTNRNEWKFSLGKLSFHKGHSKANDMIHENKVVLDVNDSNFKPLRDITTHWGQNLVDFHHELFDVAYPMFKDARFDLSEWLASLGGTAKDYYLPFLALFVRDGILFENFMPSGKEGDFTRNIILPALMAIKEKTGVRPLIVALEPTHREGDNFWLSYPYKHKELVDKKHAV